MIEYTRYESGILAHVDAGKTSLALNPTPL